jgi:hypothetical protein
LERSRKSRDGRALLFPQICAQISQMSDRLHALTVEELHAPVFHLNAAETVELLDEVTAELRDRDDQGVEGAG